MSTPLSLAEAKDLIRLCETGRRYDIEAWIRTGRSLATPKEIRETPLGVAISISDVALSKVCKHLQVPKPQEGTGPRNRQVVRSRDARS